MISLILWEGGGIYFLKGNVMFFHYSGVWGHTCGLLFYEVRVYLFF